jgi:hypothetical protein
MSEAKDDFGRVVAVLPADGWEILYPAANSSGVHAEPLIGWSVNADGRVGPISVSNNYGGIHIAGGVLHRRGEPAVYGNNKVYGSTEAWLADLSRA